MDLFNLSGRVAIVTGASRGLGREMSLALAEAGADVVMTARSKAQLEQSAGEVAAATGRKALPIVMDVTSRDSVESAVKRVMSEFGRIDILVNNAGINVRAPIGKITDDDWHMIQEVNVTGVMYCCRAVAPHMVKAGFGRIINVGSAMSLVGLPGRVSYTASKGAVVQISRTLGCELAKTGVTVNCLCPGPFLTELNRPLLENPEMAADILGRVAMGRWAQMHEIHAPIVFLASPAASFVTGAILSVDGGWVAQ